MVKTTKELVQAHAKDIPLYATIASAAIGLVLFNLNVLRPEQLSQLILILLIPLTFNEVIKSAERTSESGDVRDIRAAISQVERGLSRVEDAVLRVEDVSRTKVAVAKRPESVQDYAELWGGFSDQYFAYNPAYRLEGGIGIDLVEIAKAVFVPRFWDADFKKAHYLFLTGDREGEDDLETFRKLMSEVKASCPAIQSKLEVRELKDRPATAEGEIYLGTKWRRQTSIVEPKELAFCGDVSRGCPYCYLVITDERINERLKEHFDKNWRNATRVDILADPARAPRGGDGPTGPAMAGEPPTTTHRSPA